MSTQRRGGSARIDTARLDRELALRGVSARQLAARAVERGHSIDETAISRARRAPVRYATLRAIAIALMTFPLLEGTELIVTQKERELDAEALAVPA